LPRNGSRGIDRLVSVELQEEFLRGVDKLLVGQGRRNKGVRNRFPTVPRQKMATVVPDT